MSELKAPEPLDGEDYDRVTATVLAAYRFGLTGSDVPARLVATVEATRRIVDDLAVQLKTARSLRLGRPADAVDPAVHTPERIGAYLGSRGWSIDTQGVLASFWSHPDRPGDDARLLVPATNRGSDYPKRVGEIASYLAALDGVGELQVLDEIAASDGGSGDA